MLITLSILVGVDKVISMRRALDSPFSPGSDAVPQVWAGRTQYLSDWRDVVRPRRMNGIYERGRTILGEAGLGKSSLVRRIARDARDAGDWVTPQLRIPLRSDPMKRLASALLDLAKGAGIFRGKRFKNLLSRVEAVSIHGTGVTLREAPGPEPHSALTDLLIEIGRAAREQRRMVLVHVDEVQNITDEAILSQLLVALGDTLAHADVTPRSDGGSVETFLPIAVYLTGLPEFSDMTGARKGATFSRRFQTATLTPISDDDFAAALRPFISSGWPTTAPDGATETVYMEPAAADLIIERACGEPFLFQLAGEKAWLASPGETITLADARLGWQRAADEAEDHVQRILRRLPERERTFVETMAQLDPPDRQLTTIAKQMGYSKGSDAGPTSERLDRGRGIINRGRPYTFRHRAVEAFLTSEWPHSG